MQIEKGRASLDQSFSEIRHYALSSPERVCDKRLCDELHIRDVLKGNYEEPPFVSS